LVGVLLDVEDVGGMVESFANMESIIVDNAGEKLLKRWVLKSTVRIKC